VFVFALHCLVGDFRRDAQAPTNEHTNLREHQVLYLALHYPISLAEFFPFRRAFRVFLVVSRFAMSRWSLFDTSLCANKRQGQSPPRHKA
jgi:hypothetical protein